MIRMDLLGIEIEVCSIHLVESPKKVLCRAIYIVAARVVREVVAQRRLGELGPEQVDLIQEQDDRCSHEPS